MLQNFWFTFVLAADPLKQIEMKEKARVKKKEEDRSELKIQGYEEYAKMCKEKLITAVRNRNNKSNQRTNKTTGIIT